MAKFCIICQVWQEVGFNCFDCGYRLTETANKPKSWEEMNSK